MIVIPGKKPNPALCNIVAEMIASTNPEAGIAGQEKRNPKTSPRIALTASRTKIVFMTIRASIPLIPLIASTVF